MDTTIGVKRETHDALKREKKKGEDFNQTILRIINESKNGEKCPICGSKMKVEHARPFNVFMYDLACTNCEYSNEFEALKGVEK
jgi:transcription elongation factor Elf1